MGSFTTHLVLKECIPDIFRHFRDSQNVTLTLLVPLRADTIVEHDAVIPNRPESSGGGLVQSCVRVDRGHLLEQLFPSFMLVVTLECVITPL